MNLSDSPGLKLGRFHTKRLREVYRSAGWPFQDTVEIELIAAGLLERASEPGGHDKVRVTASGIAHLAQSIQKNRQNRSAHELLVDRVAQTMVRDGRIVWTHLSLRAKLPSDYHEDIKNQALGQGLMAYKLQQLSRYETHLDRKFERTLGMLVKLKVMRMARRP